MFIDPEINIKPEPLLYNPFKALVVPRPIGWISTISSRGTINLAPYSFFNGVADDPPCVMYCPNGTHPEGGPKDSLINVEETGEFVFNLCNWDLHKKMNLTSEHLPRNVDEMSEAGLEPLNCVKVKPPRVAVAPAAFECRYLKTVKLPTGRSGRENNLVLGEVVGIHIDESVILDGRVSINLLKPVARLGYMDYTVVTESFAMERPD